jgi:hypothetical protein
VNARPDVNLESLDRAYAFAMVRLSPGGDRALKPVQLFAWGINARVDGRPPITVDEEFAAKLEGAFAVRGVEYPIDYNHASLLGFQDAPAAGWIRSVKVIRPDQAATAGLAAGVWLVPEWTPKARQRINESEYRYMSAVLRRDAETGGVLPELTGAALTNTPAIHGLNAVAASRQGVPSAKRTPPASPPPEKMSELDFGGGQREFSCPCGWVAIMVPTPEGFGVSVTDRETYGFTTLEGAELAVEESARQHQRQCPRAGGATQ